MNLQDKNVPPLLCVEHLKKNFGTHIVLRDVNMKIQKGEVVSIIGASGSGKSTFLRCINHLERPTDGIISFNGENIKSVHFDMTRYRAKVGMVFKLFNLFNNMSVLKNCVEGPVHVLHIPKEKATEEAMY